MHHGWFNVGPVSQTSQRLHFMSQGSIGHVPKNSWAQILLVRMRPTTIPTTLASVDHQHHQQLNDIKTNPTETAATKLFAFLLVDISSKPPRECAFALDEFNNLSPANMQLYITSMYNSAPTSLEQTTATNILHTIVVPDLFQAIEHQPSSTASPSGGAGDNGNASSPKHRPPADPEVAHRLIRALLRPPSTWLTTKPSPPQSRPPPTMMQSFAKRITTTLSFGTDRNNDDNHNNNDDDDDDDKTQQARQKQRALSNLRMKLLLEYARCTCESFQTPAQGQMLANAYGAIIGSLQGTDPSSPEVAVVVVCVQLLCDRLCVQRKRSGSKGGGEKKGGGKDEDEEQLLLRVVAIHTGLEVLVLALELVPGTALITVWDMIAGVVGSVRETLGKAKQEDQKHVLMVALANHVNQMEDNSRRALVTRKLMRMNAFVVQSKL